MQNQVLQEKTPSTKKCTGPVGGTAGNSPNVHHTALQARHPPPTHGIPTAGHPHCRASQECVMSGWSEEDDELLLEALERVEGRSATKYPPPNRPKTVIGPSAGLVLATDGVPAEVAQSQKMRTQMWKHVPFQSVISKSCGVVVSHLSDLKGAGRQTTSCVQSARNCGQASHSLVEGLVEGRRPKDERVQSPRRPSRCCSDAAKGLVGESHGLVDANGENRERRAERERDIEDFVGSADVPYNRLQAHRARGLSVTDFSACEWCEMNVAFSLRFPELVVETQAMRSGTFRHQQLEEEIHSLVAIATRTREDVLTLKVLNTIFCLQELLRSGMTRELSLWGRVAGQWVSGTIDEVARNDDNGTLLVTERKTRFRPSAPGQAQLRGARLQVMMYAALLEALPQITRPEAVLELCETRDVKLDGELCEGVRDYGAELGLANLSQPAQAFEVLAALVDCLPTSVARMQLVYEWQQDGSLLHVEDVEFDRAWLDSRVEEHLGFWLGVRGPKVVPENEGFKCRYCQFAKDCPRGAGTAGSEHQVGR